MPPEMPDSTPEELMVPTGAVLLLQVPPEIALANDNVLPSQTLVPPVIAEVALTVMTALELQPVVVV